MNVKPLKLLSAALLSLGMIASAQLIAEEDLAPAAELQAKSAATESVQPQIDAKATDQAVEKRKKIIVDAVAAVSETKRALRLLDEKKSEEALAALETATGKLELILARDPALALAPVDVEVVTYDLLASPDTVKAMIGDAEDYIGDGEIQKARALMTNMASEMVFRTTSIPLATYPEAIKAVVPLIDQGKLDEAKAALQVALSTLVVTADDVIPLPVLRAENLLKNAEALAENEERTVKDNQTLAWPNDWRRLEISCGWPRYWVTARRSRSSQCTNSLIRSNRRPPAARVGKAGLTRSSSRFRS